MPTEKALFSIKKSSMFNLKDSSKQKRDNNKSDCHYNKNDVITNVSVNRHLPIFTTTEEYLSDNKKMNLMDLICNEFKPFAIKYISKITKGWFVLNTDEILINITKNSKGREVNEDRRYKTNFSLCVQETREMPIYIREFFKSKYCDIVKKININNNFTEQVNIYIFRVDGYGKDICVSTDTAVNTFLMQLKHFHDLKKMYYDVISMLPLQSEYMGVYSITPNDCLNNIGVGDDINEITFDNNILLNFYD